MIPIPQRLTLVSQAASALREGIQSGVWSKRLAGEHQLCARLQVSRVTLRAALAQLEREGLVKSRQGRCREIFGARAEGIRGPKSKRVVLLTPMPLEVMERFALCWIDDLRRRLNEAGYHLEVEKCRSCFSARPEPALGDLVNRLDSPGWVIYQTTARIQQWFFEQALPGVIIGSRHAGVNLPSVDLDYRAVCRHAGGLLLARGHRRMAFLNPKSELAGDKESEVGFLEAVGDAQVSGADAWVIHHNGTLKGICHQLDTHLRRTPRFTALLISHPKHVLTVLGHLNRRGVRVPQDVALIARDNESFLDHVLPSVARYAVSPREVSHRVSRLVLDMVRRGIPRRRHYRLMPQFVTGESLAATALKNM